MTHKASSIPSNVVYPQINFTEDGYMTEVWPVKNNNLSPVNPKLIDEYRNFQQEDDILQLL